MLYKKCNSLLILILVVLGLVVFAQHSFAATYTITPSSNAGGYVYPSEPVVVESGAAQTFTLWPNPGYYVSAVTANGVSIIGEMVDNSITLSNVVSDVALEVVFSKANMPFVGLEAENQGSAAWNVPVAGPEPTMTGHEIPWTNCLDNAYYYLASRDYVVSSPTDSTGALHFIDPVGGFPNFTAALAQNDFNLSDVTMRFNLMSLGDDIEGQDWFFDGNIETRYYKGQGNLVIRYQGQDLVGGPLPVFRVKVNYNDAIICDDDQIYGDTGYVMLKDLSGGAELAAALLSDVGGMGVKFSFDSLQPAGQIDFNADGRAGAYFEAQSGNMGLSPISISPTAFDFGDVISGLSSSQTFTIYNNDVTDIALGAIQLTGIDNNEFQIQEACSSQPLAAGSTCEVTVVFSPQAAGVKGAVLNVPFAAPDAEALNVSLTGTGQTNIGEAVDNTALVWTKGGSADWFGQTAVAYFGGDAAQSGAIGHSQSTWVETTVSGPAALSYVWKVSSEGGYDYIRFSIDGVDQGGAISGQVDWQQKSATIPQGSHTLRWSYSKDGSVSSGSDAAWLDQVVVTSYPIDLECSGYDFGEVNTGASASKVCTLTAGEAGAELGTLTVTGADFTVTEDFCSGQALDPSSSCSFQMNFAPSAGGSRSAVLGIPVIGLSGSAGFTFTGTGVAPYIGYTPSSFFFSATYGDTATQSDVLSISNAGGSTLNWTVSTGGEAWLSVSPEIGTGAGSVTATVNPNGLSYGTHYAYIYIYADYAPNSGSYVNVSFQINAPNIEVNPASLSYVTKSGSSSLPRTITVTNTGTLELSVSSATIAGPNASDFAVQTNDCGTLTPGGSCSVAVVFSPSATGSREATLVIASNDPDTPSLNIPLTGISRTTREAAQAGLDYLVPATKAWSGGVCYGCHIQAQTMVAAGIGKAHQYLVADEDINEIMDAMMNRSGWQEDGSFYASGYPVTGTTFAGHAMAVYDELLLSNGTNTAYPPYTTHMITSADRLIAWQQTTDGYLWQDHYSPPVDQSNIMATANAISTWKQAYARTDDPKYLTAIGAAASWIRNQVPAILASPSGYFTQDKTFVILGLLWSGAPRNDPDILQVRTLLGTEQQVDGNWALGAGYGGSLAYATGQVLYTLKQLGVADSDPAVLNGTDWLMNNQRGAGSWPRDGYNSCDDYNGTCIAEAMWGVLGLVSYDVITVNITSPADGARVSGVTTITAEAASNQEHTITGMDLFIDNVLVTSVSGTVISHDWDVAGAADGYHELKVTAADDQGGVGARTIRVITGSILIGAVSVNPNPFDPQTMDSTMISYSLISEPSVTVDVTVQIYSSVTDTLGERVPDAPVKTLVDNASMFYGNYQQAWDGTDDDGQLVNDGFYFAKISATDGASSQTVFDTIGVYPVGAIATISGTITSQGSPVAGARVEALSGGAVMSSARSTSSGFYRVNLLLEGTYDLRASAPGYRTDAAAHTGIVVEGGANITEKDFSLIANQHIPVIAPVPDITMNEGAAAIVDISVTDGDGDTAVITVTGLPVFASFADFTNNTARLTINPVATDAGFYTLTITADDGMLSSATSVNITVSDTLHIISATAGQNGTISQSGTVIVNDGSSVSFEITPVTGYRVEDVLIDGLVSLGSVTTYTFMNVTADHTISASFATNTYTITVLAGENGTIMPPGPLVTTEGGADAKFDITPGDGYRVEDVLIDLVSVGSVTAYTFTNVDADHTIEAIFVSYTTPEFTLIFPVQDSVINTDRVEFTLNKNMTSGSVTYTRAGGAPDDSHTYTLKNAELAAGSRNVQTGLPLVNGAIYTVTFTVYDGVDTVSAIVNNVTYDTGSLTITKTRPAKKGVIKDAMASYTLSETAQSGKVTFTRTGGAADSVSQHVQYLTGAALDAGSHTVDTGFSLVNGSFYTVSFEAWDLAGNPATTVSNALVFYDSNYGAGPAGNVANEDGLNIANDADVARLKTAMGSRPGDPDWNPVCDLDRNNVIDQKDLMILLQHFGASHP